MRRAFLLTLFAACFSVATAQISLKVAVDFTVTDTDGKEHNLFKYFEEGKYVLIDFWATW